MDSLFYTIAGLPIHALVVHFAVVLLPLATAAFIASIYFSKFKNNYAFVSIVGIFLGTGAAFVAKQSGEALAAHIGNPQQHSKLGNLLPLLSFALFVVSVLWYQSSKGRRAKQVGAIGHLSAVVAVGVIGLTFLVGHTGAEAVWKGRLPQSNQAAASNGSTSSGKSSTTSKSTGTISKTGITSAEVSKHSTPTSCWSSINGNVYDLSNWINRHPGGAGVIKTLCGKDGSSMFNNQHGGQSRPANELSGFKIGKLA